MALRGALLWNVLGGAGCESRVATRRPVGTTAITLTAENKATDHAVKRNHLLVLTLPPAPPAHRWIISYHDMRYLKLMSDVQPAPSAQEGAGVSFLTLLAGRTRLRFVLVPATEERVVQPADQQELRLTIQ